MDLGFFNCNDNGWNEYDEMDETSPSRDFRSILIWSIILLLDCGVGLKAIVGVWLCLFLFPIGWVVAF